MKKSAKPIAIALLTLFSLQLLTSCFGKFPLTRKVYEFNAGLMGNDLTGRLVRTLIFWVLNIIPVYSIASLIDLIILNLIEFWTGTNPLSMAPGQTETQKITMNGIDYSLTASKNQFTMEVLNGKLANTKHTVNINSNGTITAVRNGNEVKIADYSLQFASNESINKNLVFVSSN
ncbi:MAG: DUF3332 family protein [Bacteroidota bacterium]|nr:DUF3332 family protein [Bacteroidota bacterium]